MITREHSIALGHRMRWKTQSETPEIMETGQREDDWHYTSVSLTNPNDMMTARYVITADPAWQQNIEFHGYVGDDNIRDMLTQAILTHYAHPEVDTLSLHIPPGTWKQFRLRWRTISRVGRVNFGHHRRWVRYRCPSHFELELLGATYQHDHDQERETPPPLDPALSLTYVPLTLHIFDEIGEATREEASETTTTLVEVQTSKDEYAGDEDTTPAAEDEYAGDEDTTPIAEAPMIPALTGEATDLLAGGNEIAYAESLTGDVIRPHDPIPVPTSRVDWEESTSTEVAPLFPEGFSPPQSPEPATEPEPEPSTGVETGTATEPEPEPSTGVETETTTEPEPEPSTGAGTETTTEPEPEPSTGAETETTTEPEPEPSTGAETGTATEPEPEPSTGAETETTTEPEPEPEPEAVEPGPEPVRMRDQIGILVMGGVVLAIIVTAAFLLLPNTQTLFSTQAVPTPTRTLPPDIPTDIPILLYHHIREGEEYDDDAVEQSVAPDLFAEQMAWLDEQEYTALRMSELVDCLQGEQSCPERPVVLTFDGGYEESMQAALPILEQHGLVATWYIPVGVIDTPGYLSWEQIETLRDHGMEIGAAGMHATDLRQQTAEEARQEIVESREILEMRLDIPISSFAYPEGKYTQDIAQMVRDAGYTNAVTTVAASMVGDVYELPRRRILGGEPLSAFIWYVKPLHAE